MIVGLQHGGAGFHAAFPQLKSYGRLSIAHVPCKYIKMTKYEMMEPAQGALDCVLRAQKI